MDSHILDGWTVIGDYAILRKNTQGRDENDKA